MNEQLIGDILLAMVKLFGHSNTVWLAHTTLAEREPNEVVYIEKQPNGSLKLTVKDHTTLEQGTWD